MFIMYDLKNDTYISDATIEANKDFDKDLENALIDLKELILEQNAV